jgi:hypothetical protein
VPNHPIEIRYRLKATTRSAGDKRNSKLPADSTSQPAAPQLPRITRLMALAIKLQQQVLEHAHLTYQELARLGHVSPARLTQVLNLLYLAPDLQEWLLWLEPTRKGRDCVNEHTLRRITGIYDWQLQREAVRTILSDSEIDLSGIGSVEDKAGCDE